MDGFQPGTSLRHPVLDRCTNTFRAVVTLNHLWLSLLRDDLLGQKFEGLITDCDVRREVDSDHLNQPKVGVT